MSDILLDLRSNSKGAATTKATTEAMCFQSATVVYSYTSDFFSLYLSSAEPATIWAPAKADTPSGPIIVALAGRVTLTEEQLQASKPTNIEGGLVPSILLTEYLRVSTSCLPSLNGNFAIVILDVPQNKCHFATDRAGTVRLYTDNLEGLVFSTHPDLLADYISQSENLDLDSLAEFLSTGFVSEPYTYYTKVVSVPPATALSFKRSGGSWSQVKRELFFKFCPNFAADNQFDNLAEELGEALRSSIASRTRSYLGTTAVATSGGMDSRTILSNISKECNATAFTLIDSENEESDVAREIATSCHVPFFLIFRPFEYYGATAPLGVHIGGGLGCLASNHFLGISEWLRAHKFQNLLTGCYCDYLFKGLASNTSESLFLRKERLAAFQKQYYRPHFDATIRNGYLTRHKHFDQFANTRRLSSEQLFELEVLRIFPLSREADNAQRVIPQRILPWFPPAVDNELLKVFCKIPPWMKLNNKIFGNAIARICPKHIISIRNSNTSVSINSSAVRFACGRFKSAALNRFKILTSKDNSTRGSWPNWNYYLPRSITIKSQLSERSPFANEILRTILHKSFVEKPISAYKPEEIELFQRVWTLGLWLDMRIGKCQGKPGIGLQDLKVQGNNAPND